MKKKEFQETLDIVLHLFTKPLSMPNHDESIHISAALNVDKFDAQKIIKKTPLDLFSLAISTCGVGYIPLAPGTWGSAVGVLLYLFFRSSELQIAGVFSKAGYPNEVTTPWLHVFNSVVFLLFCFLGIWASGQAGKIFKNKDPQKVIVDEVMGQLMVFLFVPFNISWRLVLAGFILFRLFDIWKPYPINSLENLPVGIGICADDILAGVYGGICLAVLYAVVNS